MGEIPLFTPSTYITDPEGVEDMSRDPVVVSSGCRTRGSGAVHPDTSTRRVTTTSRDNFLYIIR
jgi:hypothetical protein